MQAGPAPNATYSHGVPHVAVPYRPRAFQSRVYEYYDPDVSSVARPIQLEVRPR
jgi:hypothetical protein